MSVLNSVVSLSDFSRDKISSLESLLGLVDSSEFIDRSISLFNERYASELGLSFVQVLTDNEPSISFRCSQKEEDGPLLDLVLKFCYYPDRFKRELMYSGFLNVPSNYKFTRIHPFVYFEDEGENVLVYGFPPDAENVPEGFLLQYDIMNNYYYIWTAIARAELNYDDINSLPSLSYILNSRINELRPVFKDNGWKKMGDILEQLPRNIERLDDTTMSFSLLHGNFKLENIFGTVVINPNPCYGDRFFDMAYLIFSLCKDALVWEEKDYLDKTVFNFAAIYMRFNYNKEYQDKYDVASRIYNWLEVIAVLHYDKMSDYTIITEQLLGRQLSS